MNTLIVLGGLPGTGKTTIAKLLARRLCSPHLRVDTIETALLRSGEVSKVDTAGYVIAYAIARDSLVAGATVVADAVNALPITRAQWRQTGLDTGSMVVEVQIVCSDQAEHRRRVESRHADIEGHIQPTWQDVLDREYAPWPEAALTIDTASISAEGAVASILAFLGK